MMDEFEDPREILDELVTATDVGTTRESVTES